MGIGIVYCHTNKVNGKVYVGQTWRTMEVRWRQHCLLAAQGEDCFYFQNAIRKYGVDVWEHKILARVRTQLRMDVQEKLWIYWLKADKPGFGYNLLRGGGGWKFKQGKLNQPLHKKRALSQETREGYRFRARKNPRFLGWNKGLPHSDEWKRRIGEAVSRAAQMRRLRKEQAAV